MGTGWEPSGRVVVTGIGTLNALGNSVDEFWPRLLAGESGVGTISLMDPSDYPTQIAAEVKGFDAGDWLEPKEARRIDRFIAFAAAAAKMALDDADFPTDEDLKRETGVLIGSGIGGLTFLGEQIRILFDKGPKRVSPFLVPYMIPDMASGYVSILHGFKGPNTCVVTACSTGANAIGDAFRIIERGDARAMVCGGSESPINEIGLAGFCAARAMSTRNDEPQRASRPFDKDRDGFVMGEGAAVLILEDYALAKERGAKMYGEVVGYGMTGDAFHITAIDPSGDGPKRAMQIAIDQAGFKPDQVDYINAHGTSTQLNDPIESAAIKGVLGEHAYNTPVSSTKSMTGHALGAAGALEASICLLAMRDGIIPPTANLDNPDPECDLDYVPHKARKAQVDRVLSNSFGFGGHNVCLAFKRVDG